MSWPPASLNGVKFSLPTPSDVRTPIGLYVDTFGTAAVPEARIADAIREVFDLRPLGMIEDLDLLRPIYRETAAYGHFGREQFPWEATNRVDALKAALA